ncbi:unnamed protein product [Trichogramma brassicae]|uniref:Uncharacterized protein n=1 Tax=Trichogramma brassicae TaxID=86971 RepID=A0A6H5IN05_9HYME|nr:unnamed protein product [Trichogramma brassicae]
MGDLVYGLIKWVSQIDPPWTAEARGALGGGSTPSECGETARVASRCDRSVRTRRHQRRITHKTTIRHDEKKRKNAGLAGARTTTPTLHIGISNHIFSPARLPTPALLLLL